MFFTCKHIYFSKISYISSMNWKQFLKPDWRKIVITIIILLLWILPNRFIVYTIKAECKMCPDYWPDNCPGGNYVDYLIIPKICSCCVSLSELYNDYLWNLFIPLVIFYLLSCLIVWIYHKLRKKK